MLANLTPLEKSLHSGSKKVNNRFAAKKDFYRKSAFAITNQLADWDNWTRDAIDKRQKKLVDLAANVWNFEIGGSNEKKT